jgi:hypothetical protein
MIQKGHSSNMTWKLITQHVILAMHGHHRQQPNISTGPISASSAIEMTTPLKSLGQATRHWSLTLRLAGSIAAKFSWLRATTSILSTPKPCEQ